MGEMLPNDSAGKRDDQSAPPRKIIASVEQARDDEAAIEPNRLSGRCGQSFR
jgi:hypothetical protein